MSTALKTAIYNRLTGVEVLTGVGLAAQIALAALLGTDPDTHMPAVHDGNHSKVVVFPAVTFRPNAGLAVPQYSTSGVAIDDAVWDMEFWGNTDSSTVIGDIDLQVSILLDGRRSMDATGAIVVPAMAVPNAHGRIFWATVMVPMCELYDSRLRATFGMVRYRFVEARF